ncbi:MAG: hypothetical protein F4118_10065 [Acidimicrobiaceae bacterium]|nr:hypothetical protein [Candidatus Poribacteria bacterium]MYI36753.1 hypothetical protein [Acidimicrobiaceae bacterium]
MSTRLVLRTAIRRYAGETNRHGTWSDDDINAWIDEAQSEHAQRALSVKKRILVSSARGIQEYVLPTDFGELMSVRFAYTGHEGTRGLTYVTKDVILDWGYSNNNLGDPEYYYYDQDIVVGDIIGLYPIPDKKRLFEYVFAGNCPHSEPIQNYDDNTTFQNIIELQIKPTDLELEAGDELDPCRVWSSQVDLFMSRKGFPFPGDVQLEFHGEESKHISRPIPAGAFDIRPEWVPFDFTRNPIEINEDVMQYTVFVKGSTEYMFPVGVDPRSDNESVLEVYGGLGVHVGSTLSDGADGFGTAYMRMNRLRNDIEINYYRNYCDPITDDDLPLEVPKRYHRTLQKMVLEKMYSKGGFDLRLQQKWKSEADAEIMHARAQAIIPTMGERSEIRSANRLQPNYQYDQATGVARVRIR